MDKKENVQELITKLKDIDRLNKIISENETFEDIYHEWDSYQVHDDNYDDKFNVSSEEFSENYLAEYCWNDKIDGIFEKIKGIGFEPNAPNKKEIPKPTLISKKSILISFGILAFVFIICLLTSLMDGTFITFIMFGITICIIGFVLGIKAIKNNKDYKAKLTKQEQDYKKEYVKYESEKEKYELEKKEIQEKNKIFQKEYDTYVEKLRVEFIKDVNNGHETYHDAKLEMIKKRYCESAIGDYEGLLEDKYIPYANRLCRYLEREQAQSLNEALVILDRELEEEAYRNKLLKEEQRKNDILQQEADERQEELERHNAEMEAQARVQAWQMQEQARAQTRALEEQARAQTSYAKQQAEALREQTKIQKKAFEQSQNTFNSSKCFSCAKNGYCQRDAKHCTGFAPKLPKF